LFLDYDIFYS